MLNHIADMLKSVAAIVSFLLVVALILVVGKDVIWPTPTIENVFVPSLFQQWGYAPSVFAQEISDGTREIEQNSKRENDIAHPRQSIGTQTIEAKIPGSDFTTRSAAQFISNVLAIPSSRIVGEVTKVGDVFRISVRVIGGEHLAVSVKSTGDSADAKAIIKAGAELAMQLVYPYTLAASLYNDEKDANSPDFLRTIGVLDYMLRNSKEPYWAHNLKCNVLTELAKFDDAEKKIHDAEKECKDAIELDPDNWPAHANFGYLYYSLAQKGFNPIAGGASTEAKENCRKAVEQFTKAEQEHHLKGLYGSWAMCLDVLGKQDEARQIKRRLENKN